MRLGTWIWIADLVIGITKWEECIKVKLAALTLRAFTKISDVAL